MSAGYKRKEKASAGYTVGTFIGTERNHGVTGKIK